MRERPRKTLFGYGIRQTDALLSELNEQFAASRAESERAIDDLEARLATAEAACQSLEGDIARLHEAHAADLAILSTLDDLRTEMVSAARDEIAEEERRLLQNLTSLQFQLGERRQRLRRFHLELGRLVENALTNVPSPLPARPQAPTPSDVMAPTPLRLVSPKEA